VNVNYKNNELGIKADRDRLKRDIEE